MLWSVKNGVLPFGGLLGALISGWIADRFGRRHGLLMANILIIFSATLFISSRPLMSYVCLLIGRFLTGVFSGLSCSILPLYLMEISPDNLRGSVGSMNQLTSNDFFIIY
jgi:MFS family permease